MAWDVVSPHLGRCKELGLDISADDLSAIQDLSFPILETFHLGPLLAYDNDTCSWLSRAIEGAAKLTKVVLFWPLSSIPYSQLVTLKIRAMHEDDVEFLLSCLLECKALEYLNILVRDEPSGQDLPTMDVNLPSFNRLKICVNEPINANNIVRALLHSLTMPSLVKFKLSQDRWPGHDVLHVLTQRSPLLQRLEMTTIHVGNELHDSPVVQSSPLLSFLSNLSHLEHFKFEFASANEKLPDASIHLIATSLLWLLSRLSLDDDHSDLESKATFLPKLQYMHLHPEHINLDASVVHQFREVAVARILLHFETRYYSDNSRFHVRTVGEIFQALVMTTYFLAINLYIPILFD
ncbi:hypothetical protein AAF712_015259 [Marasmius tenuissimus]|uniref:FBD domain-containing protein n=1 Tax=Marasmius tenuissimus TaxID=585030 RepID=A0ABR2Z8S9_9AGAR